MLFEGEIELEDFYKRYGGQRSHGICTPRNKPYIYLIYSPDSEHGKYGFVDNIEYDGEHAPETIRFALEGKGDEKSIGNSAVIHHADNEEGVYKSLLLFYLKNGRIRCIGDYRYVGMDDDKKYFKLKRTTDLDEVEVSIVVPDYEERSEEEKKEIGYDGGIKFEKINPRGDYNFLDSNISTQLVNHSGQYELYDFVDKDGNKIDINGESNTARKAQQFIDIIRGYHKELRNNNYIIVKDSTTGEEHTIAYEPKLKPNFTPDEVKFYVVNIGWGLCQILSFKSQEKNEVWVFDCGGSGGKYKKNLQACLTEIFGNERKKYRIDKLFVSHPHIDHFNKHSLFEIDSDTEIWINPNIAFCTHGYLKFLERVKNNNCKVVEPIVRTGTCGNTIEVLHPDGHITLHKKGSRVNYPSPLCYANLRRSKLFDVDENNMNELSPIIQLNIEDRVLIITGDVMGRGWEFYIRKNMKKNMKKYPDCYVHSHHGTTSGFEINLPTSRGAIINNEYDLFDAKEADFISLIDGYTKGGNTLDIDAALAGHPGLSRTDEGEIKYYRYDLKTGIVDMA